MRFKANLAGHSTASGFIEAEFSIDLPTVTAPDLLADVGALYKQHKRFIGYEGEDDSELLDGQTRACMPLIEQRTIDLKQADRLLLEFRSKSHFFPFVRVPQYANVPSLSRTSPFLLLAILTVATLTDPRLHHQMDHEFREIVTSKVIIEGQKSLDILQALLIYIAWYPIRTKPQDDQAFIYMNLATSVAFDIGLEKEFPHRGAFSSRNDLVENSFLTIAAKKAFLGCYYLSSFLAMGFRKPNNIRYRDLIARYSETLVQGESLNSIDIAPLLKLQRLIERMDDAHQNAKLQINDSSDTSSLFNLHIQMFCNELQAWRTSTDAEIRTLPSVGLLERIAAIIIYYHPLGFSTRPYHTVLKPFFPGNEAHLFACLAACKQFFDYIISFSDSIYLCFTTVHWGALVQATLVLSRLTFLMASTLNWSSETTRSNIPLATYLDCLIYRFQNIVSMPHPKSSVSTHPQNPDIFYVFAMMMNSVQKSYMRRVDCIDRDSFTGEIKRSDCPMQDPDLSAFLNADLEINYDNWVYTDSSRNTSSVNSQPATSTPIYFDLWATMTGTWAQEF